MMNMDGPAGLGTGTVFLCGKPCQSPGDICLANLCICGWPPRPLPDSTPCPFRVLGRSGPCPAVRVFVAQCRFWRPGFLHSGF